MAELLPDIDESVVGQIVYWNALDHGASYLDPSEVAEYSGVSDWTAYDNGFTGKLDADNRLRWRAKTDGWIVVYYDTSIASVNNWTFLPDYENAIVDVVENEPAIELNNLRKNASNSDEMEFNYEDVGFFDYNNRNHSRYESYQFTPGSRATWTYKPGERPTHAYVAARSTLDVNGESIEAIYWDNHEVIPEQVDAGTTRDQFDMVPKGWVSTSENMNMMSGGQPSSQYSTVSAGLFAMHE